MCAPILSQITLTIGMKKYYHDWSMDSLQVSKCHGWFQYLFFSQITTDYLASENNVTVKLGDQSDIDTSPHDVP